MAIDRDNYYVFLNDQSKPFRFYEAENAVLGIETDGAVLMTNASTGGIKVDLDTPDYPWHDLIGDLKLHSPGASDPTYATYIGNLKAYQFDNIGDQMLIEFHIPHDYAVGTDLYIHAHWSHTSTSVTTGSVTWGFEVSYAKGHNQSAFPTPIITSVTENASTIQRQHMIAEVQLSATSPTASQLDTDDIETDGVILVSVTLDANTMSASTNPFLHFVDIHYQSTNIGTKNKAPNFHT